MGEYHTAYGEAPHMGTSLYLLNIPPMGTFHLSGHPSFGNIFPEGTFHFWGYIIYGDTPSVGEYHHLLMGTSHLREHSTSGDPMENKIMSSFVILTTHDVSPIFR